MWTAPQSVGKSFDNAGTRPMDSVSDAHDMVCVVLQKVPAPGDIVTSLLSGITALPSDSPITIDADELDYHPAPFDAASPVTTLQLQPAERVQLREDATIAVAHVQQVLVQAAESSDVHADSPIPPSSPAQRHERSRSPSHWERDWSAAPSPLREYSPSPTRKSVFVGERELPVDFVEAMQELLWPVTFQERERPADLLTFDSSLDPVICADSLEATIGVAALCLTLRNARLDFRALQAFANQTFPAIPTSDSPLTFEEKGCVMDFWKKKLSEQALTKQQAHEDSKGKYTKNQMRKRERSRWHTYQSRALAHRKLVWALITCGFDVDLPKLATAYAAATVDNDASSLPPPGMRQRVLKMRAWHRWGRQLYNSVKSEQVPWDSLAPSAQKAGGGYYSGQAGTECDQLTHEYGHGMLRTGPAQASFVGQQATGSTVHRMLKHLL